MQNVLHDQLLNRKTNNAQGVIPHIKTHNFSSIVRSALCPLAVGSLRNQGPLGLQTMQGGSG
jgi:hypothetical protein